MPVTTGRSAKMTARAIVREANKASVLELALQGYSVYEIEEQLGVPKSTAHTWLSDMLKEASERNIDKAEQLRELQIAKFNRYLTKLEPDVETGDTDAIRTAILANDKINRLRGLYNEGGGVTFNDNRSISLTFTDGMSIDEVKGLRLGSGEDIINGDSEAYDEDEGN